MKFSVEYIPLNKIKSDSNLKITERVKKLRNIMWDCMHILVVKRSNNGSYTIVSGKERYEYLKRHTKNKRVPCIVDESKISAEMKYWLNRIFQMELYENRKELSLVKKICPSSLSIIKSFLNQENRFKELTSFQQLKVLYLAVRYKKTVISSMNLMVHDLKQMENRFRT
jgi:hypothetical protein